MKIFTKLISGAAIALSATAIFSAPTFADVPKIEPRSIENEPVVTSESVVEPHDTFALEEGSDSAFITFGRNVLYAGNNLTTAAANDGLSLAFGNTLYLKSSSEYAFVAGNVIEFTATTERDAFVAGNIITFMKDAKIGRDVFATGNNITLRANLSGDFSAAANSVILDDVVINGNVNIEASSIQFTGKVEIAGKLTYNEDAIITGLENATYAELETYVSTEQVATAGGIWLAKLMSVCGMFVILLIIALVFPRFKNHIAREASAQRFGMNLLRGAGLIIAVPLVVLVTFISFFAASAGIALLGAYILLFYIAQILASAWVGYVLTEKVCRIKLPIILEGAIGIVIVGCASMIPGLGMLISLAGMLLGAGLITSWIRPAKNLPELSDDTAKEAGDYKNPFRGQKGAKAKTASTSKKSTVKKSAKKTAAKK